LSLVKIYFVVTAVKCCAVFNHNRNTFTIQYRGRAFWRVI